MEQNMFSSNLRFLLRFSGSGKTWFFLLVIPRFPYVLYSRVSIKTCCSDLTQGLNFPYGEEEITKDRRVSRSSEAASPKLCWHMCLFGLADTLYKGCRSFGSMPLNCMDIYHVFQTHATVLFSVRHRSPGATTDILPWHSFSPSRNPRWYLSKDLQWRIPMYDPYKALVGLACSVKTLKSPPEKLSRGGKERPGEGSMTCCHGLGAAQWVVSSNSISATRQLRFQPICFTSLSLSVKWRWEIGPCGVVLMAGGDVCTRPARSPNLLLDCLNLAFQPLHLWSRTRVPDISLGFGEAQKWSWVGTILCQL